MPCFGGGSRRRIIPLNFVRKHTPGKVEGLLSRGIPLVEPRSKLLYGFVGCPPALTAQGGYFNQQQKMG